MLPGVNQLHHGGNTMHTSHNPITQRLAQLRTRTRLALAGAGCVATAVACSAALSAPAMAATTCRSGTTTFSSQPISATLSGDLCYNGTTAWDPNPGATKLTTSVPWYLTPFVTVLSESGGDYNYASGNKGTEEIWGNVKVQDKDPIEGLGVDFEIFLRLDCTPSGQCTSRVWAQSIS
jgi:hypothetical protein